MDARDHASYRQMYQAIQQALRPPDLLVYLRARVGTLQARIQQRGRAYESDIEPRYLERLNDLYERWFEAYALSPKVLVEADRFDFVNREGDLGVVLDRLEPYGLSAPILP